MTYELFTQLYSEALEYSDVDMYIAERGWQDWMEAFDNHGNILKDIYTLANSSLKEIRESHGYTRAAFAKEYNIPIRTLEDWESEKRTAPIYVSILIAYTFFEAGQNE